MSLLTRPARRALSAVAAVLAGLMVLTGCSIYDLPLPGGTSAGSNPIVVHVMFNDVLDLVPQSTVKVNDVSVGKVSAISLRGYVADVTLEINKDVQLPDNAIAQIRQTSLLGEKFVSLSPPPVDPSSNRLQTGDVIPLDHTGRNPEVEEVLGAFSLLLNGGGVGQLKLISEELNKALAGHEGDARLLLSELRSFTGQLDTNKQSIVGAIDNLNRLSVAINKQDPAIKSALDNLPSALRSVNGQRAALVKMLQALQRLSGIGVQVIQASKASTIDGLRSLNPILYNLGKAGSNLPNSLQVFLTYPFVDAAVGNSPRVARNLHMGDFTNLSVRLELKVPSVLPSLPIPTTVPPVVTANCKKAKAAVRKAINQQAAAAAHKAVNAVPLLPASTKKQVYNQVYKQVVQYLGNKLLNAVDCKDPSKTIAKIPGLINGVLQHILNQVVKKLVRQLTPGQLTKAVCKNLGGLLTPAQQKQCQQLGVPLPGGGGGGGGGLPTLPPLPTLGRAAFGAVQTPTVTFDGIDPLNGPVGTSAKLGYNSTLAALLLQGVDQ